MRLSKMYLPTLRQDPSEAEIQSHKLMLRSGMIRQTASGIYSYLPLGKRVIHKIEEIIRKRMEEIDSQEISMSTIQPSEIWEESGRWEVFGPEMFKLQDRHERNFCLGPTAEEYFVTLVRGELKSYKQLPTVLYQITPKFRDEKRPRFGVNRSREFIMQDGYSFDANKESSDRTYQEQWEAYERIFDEMDIEYKIVQGDSGAMGGDKSHEFIALSEIGEGQIAYCKSCDFAATDEKAEVVFHIEDNEEEKDYEEVHTPGAKTIDDLAEMLDIEPWKCAKVVILEVFGDPVMVFVPGNRELNMVKIANYLQAPEHEVEMASDETIKRITGAASGFSGPINLKEDVRIVVDSRVTKIKNMVVGANKEDYHFVGVNFKKDFDGEVADDLLQAVPGDLCPSCSEKLSFARGIEVGNIFQFGDKYSKPLNATFLDEDGKEQYFYMGSYGIGVTRTITAIIEQNYDEDGIIWPLSVAPYQAIVTIVNTKDEDQSSLGEKIYKELKSQGIEVLLDDRKDRAGAKFNDRDLIGIPLRITVGKKAGEDIVEYSTRKERENEDISSQEAIKRVVDIVKNLK